MPLISVDEFRYEYIYWSDHVSLGCEEFRLIAFIKQYITYIHFTYSVVGVEDILQSKKSKIYTSLFITYIFAYLMMVRAENTTLRAGSE